ncbi:CTR1 [Symbiodinium sp. CCMP2456]|nr:CTR1 [Symbiodinium sp. CCMP2456]
MAGHGSSEKVVMYLGLFASSSCCALGYPCSDETLVLLAFRATCVGYFTCMLVGLLLGACETARHILRAGLLINSLSSWLVSAYWCVGFGEWCILMLCEHAFVGFGTMVLVRSYVHLHLMFTAAGSLVCYLARRQSSEQSYELGKFWVAGTVTVVMILVGGIMYSGHSSIAFLQRKLALVLSIVSMSEKELLSGDSTLLTTPPNLPNLSRSSTGTPTSCSGVDGLELEECIGAGSFGKVYSATYLGKRAAVKIMSWEGEQLKRIDPVREAKLCLRMVHPNLVQAFNFVQRDSSSEVFAKKSWKEIWIIQEWCDRGTLCKYCDTPRFDETGLRQVKSIMLDVAKACEYLHSQEIIHGDLTSNNVLLQTRPASDPQELGFVCKVCDFGLARVLEEGVSTLLTSQLGTVSHMPPELIRMENRRLTKKVDIYAMGILLYQALLGRLPFAGKMAPQIIIFIASGKRLELDDQVPQDVRRIFSDCTAPLPEARPCAEELVRRFS